MTPMVPTRWMSSGSGFFDFAVFEHGETDRLSFAQRFFDELDAGFLDDRQRNDGVGKQHGFLERQNADEVSGNDRRFLLRGHSC